MQIPDGFLRKASRQFGDAGPGWVACLPGILNDCQDQWGLSNCIPVDNLSINLVCYAQSAVYGDVVLKVQGPHSERFTEIAALQIFDDRLVCRCLAVDEHKTAMLLERAVPGCDLRTLLSKRAQLEIGAALIARLPVQFEETGLFPHYRDWMARAVRTTLENYRPGRRMIALMAAMEELYERVCPPGTPQVLMHGDLHHENILQYGDDQWKIIDPQGVIGAPFLESARFIQNHVFHGDDPLSYQELDDTVAYFAEQLGQDRYTIGSAAFILHVLSTCWGYEMNYTQTETSKLVSECEKLLEYVRNI